MGGAITLDKLKAIIQKAGFTEIDIESNTVTPEYAAKWGIKEVDLQYYLRSSIITAYKPL